MPGRWPRCSVSTRVSSCCARRRRRRDLRMLLLTSILRDAAEWGYLHPPVRQFMALFDGVRSPTRVQSGGADRSRPGHLRMFVERQALTLTPQSGREKRRSSREFYRIGLSANTTGISVYVLGLEDKTYLARTYGASIGRA